MTASLQRMGITPLLRIAMIVALAATAMFAIPTARAGAEAATGPNQVVQLASTDAGFGTGKLAASFALAGKTMVSKTSAQWSAMSTADFASYDAVILNDPTCSYRNDAPASAAIANAGVWGAAIDGNVIITGTDEQFHYSQSEPYRNKGAAFVVADATKTGGWISLSCYYDHPVPTAVTWLDQAFGAPGDFSVSGTDCLDNVRIVATHPALAGLTDANMSGWGCSLHERFLTWPTNFEVLAIDLNGAAVFTAPDGSTGTPYILARGVEVISDIDLSPATATNFLGETHTLTAVVTTDDPTPGTPIVGTPVTFTVVAGPHTGFTTTSVTDGTGTAVWGYTGSTVGIDTIEATFVDALGRTQRSNRVTKEWIELVGPTCDGLPATIIGTPGDDDIDGTPGDDVIVGLAGEDNIDGKGGNDVICGGPDHDQLQGGEGRDFIYGGEGNDRIWGEDGNDVIYGGDGDDVVYGGEGRDFIYGGEGNDRLKGDNGNDLIAGEAGNDTVDGKAGDDYVHGGEGDDRLYGGDGNDAMRGGNGYNVYYGGAGDDDIRGGDDLDRMKGEAGTDTCDGGGGASDTAQTCEIVSNVP